MFDSKLLWSGRISTKLEVAERLEEITPFSTSKLQRTMKIGYGRAAHIVDLFEMLGIVSAVQDSRGRHIPLMSSREAVFTLIRYLHATLPASDDEANTLLQEDEDSDFADTEIVCLFEEESVFFEENDEESDLIISVSHEESPCSAAPELSPADQLRKAVETACARERIGTSVLQRALKIGYGRAAALINRLEEMGVVGPDPQDKTGREVLTSLETAKPLTEEWILSHGISEMVEVYVPDNTPLVFNEDENPVLFMEALEALQGRTEISASGLGRLMGISYPRASVVMQWLIEQGIVSSTVGNRRCREILLSHEEATERLDQWVRQRTVK